MIILDTNVISETQKTIPDVAVMDWLDAQDPTNLYISAITAAASITARLMIRPASRTKT